MYQQPLIAVLDDDSDFLQIMDEELCDAGYRTALYHLGSKGIEFLRQTRPAVAIIDLWFLGKAAGFDLLAEVKKDPTLSDVALVICSGDRRMLKGAQPMLQQAQVHVLEKPFATPALLALLQQLTTSASATSSQ